MDVQFDGFQSSLPLLAPIVLLAALALLAWWTYTRSSEKQPLWRWTLIALRTLTLWILLLLLLNPVFSLHETRLSAVKLALLYDNSLSTTVEKGTYEGESAYRGLMAQLDNSSGSLLQDAELSFFAFDNNVFEVESTGELSLNGTRTNLDNALVQFRDMIDGHDAVIMVSDGIITSGRDPGATAAAYPIPVFTVGIGDTIRLNDLAVRQVTHPTTASLRSRTRIQATIYNEGFVDVDIAVQLRNSSGVLDEVVVRSDEQRSVQQVRFEVELPEEGLQLFDIHIPAREGEWTTDNNTQPFSIDVRDDRLRVLHLAFEVHPDVGQIRSFLERDEQINLATRTWLGEDRYIGGTLTERPDTLDLVILHGFPYNTMQNSEAQAVADRFNRNALMIVGSPGQNVSSLSRLFSGQLPLRFEPDFAWNPVQFHVSEQEQGHAILDFIWPDDMQPTPVRGPVRHVSPAEGAQVLLRSVFRGSPMTAPLLAVRTPGDRNISHLNGFQFYEWAMSTRPEHRAFWENLLNNIVKWTAASPDEQLLRVTTSQPEYETGEPIVFNARLNNEAGDPEPNGSVTLVLSDQTDSERQERRFIMENEGDGFYRLELEQLPAGQWQFSATASRSDRELDTRSGSFSISEVVREFIHTIRNEEVLRQIAVLSSGAYLPYESISELRALLQREIGFDEQEERLSRSLPVNRHPFWFIVVLVLLAAEWAVRKYRSMV